MSAVSTLVVVSHVPHFVYQGALYAYGPYAREIDVWADLFPAVAIAAPCRHEAPPGDCLPFTRSNISVRPQREAGGDTAAAKLRQILALPAMAVGLARALRGADAIHVRCPGNLGLLGVVLAPLFSRRLVAKYAGQWNGYRGEPLAVRLQRRLLASRWWRGPVTVYGEWPNQPAHVIPFFTSMMTAEQTAHAGRVAGRKTFGLPLRIAFLGALAERKRAAALVDAARLVIDGGVPVEVTLVGDGPERRALERQVAARGLESVVRFTGALPFEEALQWHEWAHCLVLPSRHSEGWPKAVAEAMSYGVVCIAVDHGQLARMLLGRGILLPSGDAGEIAAAIAAIARDLEAHRALARQAAQWAGQYSLDGLRAALADLLTRWWSDPITTGTRSVERARRERLS